MMNAPSPASEATQASGPQANVLLVDDEPANLLALEAVLHDLGLNLVTAPSGEDALRRLEEKDYAVVLLDVQMHGLDGFETAKLVRSRERSRHTPVIFLTAHDVDRPLVEQAYSLGAVDFLVKPLVPVILRAKVAGFVDLHLKTEQVKNQAEQLRQAQRKEFDQAVRESEARKSAILETALDCIITIDHEDRIIEFNPAAERTFGYQRADVLGKPMAELIVPPPLREPHYRGMRHFLATGEGPVLNKRIEVTAQRADGTQFPVELAITPTVLGGSPIFTAYLRDISERQDRERRRNARLAVTQALAQAASINAAAIDILRAICDGLGWDVGGLWAVDREAGAIRCVEVWHAPSVYAEKFGAATRQAAFRRGEGLPGRVWELGKAEWIPDVVRDARFPRALLAAEDGLHGAFAFPILLHAEVIGVMEFFSHEVREPDPDLLEMLASIGGQVGQFMERQRAEAALRESEERFRASFHQAAVGLALVGLDHRTLWANPGLCAMLGYTDAEMRDRTFAELTHPDDLDTDLAQGKRLLAGETSSYRIEKRYLHKSGSVVWGDLTVSLVRDGAGGPKYVVGVVVDITERKAAEEALRDADRRKDQFLLMLAHELRNPLAPIQNALHVLVQPGAPEPALQQSRETVGRQFKHLTRIVNDLLEVGRAIRGRLKLQKERLDLARLVRATAGDQRAACERAGLLLELAVPELPVWVTGDPTRLTQILDNLLQNALKFTGRGGRVAVRLTVNGEKAEVAVRDTGVGIEPGVLPHIFEAFTQADRSLDRSKGGLGLGLSLVKKLVELHGGEVHAFSAGSGRGTEIAVRLPVVPEPAALSEMPSAPKPAGKHLRILVVEDNRDAADSLRMLLELYGYEVTVAYSGPDGVKAALQWRPDVVLCDIGLPGLDGYGVASELRSKSFTTKARLIAVTGYGAEEDRQRSREAGFHAHLTKPVDPATLQTVLMQATPA